jgi:hypothetical protein
MNTRTLKYRPTARPAPKKTGPTKVSVRTVELPGMTTVADRLAALSAADMPWLRKHVDLTPPDGGPEVCGPLVYQPSKRRG